ncbi:hypothetical protein MUP77_15055, partial [Candidatus Bathyarchaeota archaeon]|nr:hypothetical protein [Candidatus Bathyarchaeota archaeon]
GKLDGKRSPPPRRAKRHNPATIKVFLLLGRKGISAKGISPKDKASQGRLILEPKNTPATQAQLTYREVQNIMLNYFSHSFMLLT